MKPEMHPVLHLVTAHCQCGNEFQTRSTRKELRVEICSNCHPFWTGKQKLLDTAGRVEKFQRKFAKKAEIEANKAAQQPVAMPTKAEKDAETPEA